MPTPVDLLRRSPMHVVVDGEATTARSSSTGGSVFKPASIAACGLAAACLLAGCGGTSGPRVYSLTRTEACLNRSGEKAAAVKNSVLPGSEGNLRVAFGHGTGDVDIAFGKNEAEARAIEGHAVAITEHDLLLSRKTILSYVRLKGNVFYYSPQGPVSMIVNAKITSCA